MMAREILIADDSKNIHKVISIILEDRDCNISISETPEILLNEIQKSAPGVIFLDFHLSDQVNGYDLAKKIKVKVDSKIVLIFGTFDNVDEDKLDESGVDSYLFKPIDGDKLLNIFDRFDVGSVLSKSSAQDDGFSIDDDLAMPGVIEEFAEVKSDEEDEFLDLDLPEVISEEDTEIFKQAAFNENDEVILPEVISHVEEIDSIQVKAQKETENFVMPIEDDLGYPDMTSIEKVSNQSEQVPKFVPSDILVDVEEEDFEVEFTQVPVDKEVEEQKLDKLKSEILKELDHDLWDGDNTNTHISTAQFKEALAMDKMKESILSEIEKDQKTLKSDIRDEVLNILSEDVDKKVPSVQKISEELRPDLEKIIRDELRELVKEELHKIIEQKVWGELPQIAEKIISSELNEIKNSIID